MLEKKYIETCEDFGWAVCDYANGTVEIEQHSPAGEDFMFEVTTDNFVRDIKKYANDFSVDEHVETWIGGRGENGVPATIRELLEDAEAISKMLKELAEALSQDENAEVGGNKKYTVEVTAVTTLEVDAGSENEATEIACGMAWEHDPDELNGRIIKDKIPMVKIGKIQERYNKVATAEPVILEPEDWTPDEWKTLCKVSGQLPADRTERIVLHISAVETYVRPKQGPRDERTYVVTERCPHCENEIEMRWDTDKRGFEAKCPACGQRLMLCDECRHDESCRQSCDYDSETDTCFRRRKISAK